MLSYKEYKLLNESLYGAFNLGLKSQGTVGGIMSDSPINGTEAAIEAESEEALEEAKKGKKMKKKMDSVDVVPSDDEDEKKVSDEDHEEDEDHEDEEDSEEEDSDEDDDSEESEEEDEDEEEKPQFMKKKAKKEWAEVLSDLEAVLEEVSDEEALQEIKKGLETIKEGIKKGHKKGHKKGCDCNFSKNVKANKEEKEEDGDDEGLTDAQKKLPKALRDAILAKKGKGEKKCGKMMDKKMDEADQAWWNSVNDMLGTADQKGWDGWTEVGEVQQAVREGEQIDEGILQDIGNSKFVRNAVTAAGLGAAALGGYAARGMQGAGSNAGADRAVATARAESPKMATEQDDVPAQRTLDPREGVPASNEWIKKMGWGGGSSHGGIVMLGREGGKVVVSVPSRQEVEMHLKKMGFNVDAVIKAQQGM